MWRSQICAGRMDRAVPRQSGVPVGPRFPSQWHSNTHQAGRLGWGLKFPKGGTLLAGQHLCPMQIFAPESAC